MPMRRHKTERARSSIWRPLLIGWLLIQVWLDASSTCRAGEIDESDWPGLPAPAPASGAPEATGGEPPTATRRFAAEVGTGKISMDQVFEVWGPAWYEAMAEVRRCRLSAEACDARLQKEWERALETVIREEVFYQEAERQYEIDLGKYIDKAYEYEQQRSGPHSLGPSRAQVARRIQETEEQRLEQAVDEMVARFINASGGVVRLKEVLQARGITWEDWRERIRRKGFANRHLNIQLQPLVPRPVRPADIRDYYKRHKDEFVKPGRVAFRHILFSYEARGGETAARAAARNVYDALVAKTLTFEEAARKHSDDAASREQGGLELGLVEDVERDAWLGDVREAVRKEPPGVLGPILVSGKGCHLVMLIKAESSVPIPFAEAQRAMQQKIYAERWEAATEKYYQELREKVRIEILTSTFPEELSWRALREKKTLPVVPLGGASVLPRVESASPADAGE